MLLMLLAIIVSVGTSDISTIEFSGRRPQAMLLMLLAIMVAVGISNRLCVMLLAIGVAVDILSDLLD